MYFKLVSFSEALFIHDIQLALYGGTKGILNEGILRSALERPNTGYYENLLEAASALMESLCNNHPFVDGNKRVAVMTTFYFLKLNGLETKQYSVNNEEMYKQLIYLLEKGNCKRLELEHLLRSQLKIPHTT
jgi:death-on-curing protein